MQKFYWHACGRAGVAILQLLGRGDRSHSKTRRMLAQRSALASVVVLVATALLTVAVSAEPTEAAQRPGPSAALFASPYYSCQKNYYVSPNGTDSNSGTSSASPWATLQHANNAIPAGGSAAGSCINVAPGAYRGVVITNGGNLATSSGYVVYRCQTLDGCTVTGTVAFQTQQNTVGVPPNYIIVDGFMMAGGNSSAGGVGFSVWNGNNSSAVAAHHIWIINSIINGYGQTGVGWAASEYYYIIHNTIYNNSNLQCSSRGSGIAINIMHTVGSYTPTSDDLKNPNKLLGPTWVIVQGSFFHNAVEWNVVYNNALTQCGTISNPYDTDGNGIIFDSNLTGNGNTENYSSPSLVAFNVVYNNGGGGIHLYYSADITVANNSCFNNTIDPANSGTGRACMDESNGYGSNFVNNIAVAVPAPPVGGCSVSPPYAKFNFAILGSPSQSPYDTFNNNITSLSGISCNSEIKMYQGDSYSARANQEGTSPAWVNVGAISPGTELTPPNGTNFALRPGSPAVGYGKIESYLPSSAVDAGACAHTLSTCP